jgi:hypothetical protein
MDPLEPSTFQPLTCDRSGTARQDDSSYWGAKVMLTIFFNASSFTIVDLLPERAMFTAVSFTEYILNQLNRLQATATGNHTRRKLGLHFDNSTCHTAHLVVNVMARLHSKRVGHRDYSRNFTICDLYLLARVKNNCRQGGYPTHAKNLLATFSTEQYQLSPRGITILIDDVE